MRYHHLMEAGSRTLYHGTSAAKLATILADGVASPSWWGTHSIALYYAEDVAEEDVSQRVILSVPLSQFDLDGLEPDGNSVAEPLTTILRSSEDALYRRWQKSKGTWLDSLRIYGSVIYRGATIQVDASNVEQLAGKPKEKPHPAQANVYRSFLRLQKWGKLTDHDAQTMRYIEQHYDVSDIEL